MSEIRLHKRILAWGNSYGIRLTKKELQELEEGAEVTVTVTPVKRTIDWSKMPKLNLGPNASRDHDEILYQGWLAERQMNEQKERRSRAKRR